MISKKIIRKSSVNRKTNETDIKADINIDGTGKHNIKTPLPFFTHMLEQLAKHSGVDLNINCIGDVEIDAHHTVEDLGWTIGQAFDKALNDRKGIQRYANIALPMDECLTNSSIDISGRPWLVWKVILPNKKIGDIDSEIFREFFQAFSQSAKMTIHIQNFYGTNAHHIIESCFKALAISLKQCMTINYKNIYQVPSTKGKI